MSMGISSQGSDAMLAEEIAAEDLKRMYRVMYLSRQLDARQRVLKRQQKTFIHLSCAGHEVLHAATGLVIRSGSDWVFPYYRDQALCLMLGVSAEAVMLEAAAAGDSPYSHGRQMPNHWGDPKLRIVSTSSTTGMQFLQAVGCADACNILFR